jgi:hypothetical protein
MISHSFKITEDIDEKRLSSQVPNDLNEKTTGYGLQLPYSHKHLKTTTGISPRLCSPPVQLASACLVQPLLY